MAVLGVRGAQHSRSIDALETAIDFIIILLKKVALLRTRAQSHAEPKEFGFRRMGCSQRGRIETQTMLRVGVGGDWSGWDGLL